METLILGSTANGLPILAHRFNAGKGPRLLVLGGVHGDESEGVIAAHGLLQALMQGEYQLKADLILVPAFNLDGVAARSRLNGNGVDLNRNLPTQDWDAKAFNERYPPGPHANSEPENQALVKFLETHRPHFILSLHSWKPMLNVNGPCLLEAEAARALTGYEIVESIGYPTPGSLGTYAGIERPMPTLTYEIERGQAPREVLKQHLPAIFALLNQAAQRA